MFNKTILKNTVMKKTLILTALASMFIVGCSNDENYRREIEGNDEYLNSPALKPLVVPAGVTVPRESNDFYIYEVKSEGQLGKNLDIRPPRLSIPTDAAAPESSSVPPASTQGDGNETESTDDDSAK